MPGGTMPGGTMPTRWHKTPHTITVDTRIQCQEFLELHARNRLGKVPGNNAYGGCSRGDKPQSSSREWMCLVSGGGELNPSFSLRLTRLRRTICSVQLPCCNLRCLQGEHHWDIGKVKWCWLRIGKLQSIGEHSHHSDVVGLSNANQSLH